VPLYQYEDRIYRVTFTGATDISQSPLSSGLIGQSYTAASKTLLWKGQVGGGFGQNMEGLSLGPQLPGGNWSLLGVVDNSGGGDPLSANTLAAFSLAPSVAGDFNGNGIVDSADYIVWRKGFGTIFAQFDYDIWRTYFGQTAGSGAGTVTNAAVPEPSALLMLILAAPGWNFLRRRAA
jgi:hypothetical protein